MKNDPRNRPRDSASEIVIMVLVFAFVILPIAWAILKALTGNCDPYDGCF
jgi:hypothetical protein